MNRKKVAIVTIQNSSNYGAMLQAFALQNHLTHIGCEVKIINYDNHHMSKGLDLIRHGKSLLEMYYVVLDLVNLGKRRCMIKNFKLFSSEYLQLTELISRDRLLKNYNEKYDIYISGSDQIWNPNVTQGIVDEVYFCGMADSFQKVISYASSCGGYKFDDEEKNQKIRGYLEKYSAISTRESSYVYQLEQLTGKKIKTVLDPVFLLNKDEWEQELSLTKEKRKPYILIYAMSKHDEVIKRVIKVVKKTDYDVVMINQPLFKNLNIQYVIDAGPKEFVNLFYNASLIVTNSFHGTALGLIFNKPLQILNNARNMNRISDLLFKLNLSHLLKNEEESIDLDVEIDYEKVNSEMNELIIDSKRYLEREIFNVK